MNPFFSKKIGGVLKPLEPVALGDLSGFAFHLDPIEIYKLPEILTAGSVNQSDDAGKPRNYCLHHLATCIDVPSEANIDNLFITIKLEEVSVGGTSPASVLDYAPNLRTYQWMDSAILAIDESLTFFTESPGAIDRSVFTIQCVNDLEFAEVTRTSGTELSWTFGRMRDQTTRVKRSIAIVSSASRDSVCYVSVNCWTELRRGPAMQLFGLVDAIKYPIHGTLPSPARHLPSMSRARKVAPSKMVEPGMLPGSHPSDAMEKNMQAEVVADELPSESETKSQEVQVWYATSRKPAVGLKPGDYYLTSRSAQLHYGCCRVFIPASHITGSLGSNVLTRFLTGVDDRVKLLDHIYLEKDGFWSRVTAELKKLDASTRTALVFIHGYNTGFEEAVRRTAQISCDVDFKGITFLYSWPSRAQLLSYGADAATVEAHAGHLEAFLRDICSRPQIERIHIIAHSMGNRALLEVVNTFSREVTLRYRKPLGQVVLAAPDVDVDTFNRLAAAYKIVAERTTMYASSKDLALRASGIIHSFNRAGFTPPVTIVDGIETVKVSGVDISLLGHGYIYSMRPVIQDMSSVIVEAKSAANRYGLRSISSSKGTYWTIKK